MGGNFLEIRNRINKLIKKLNWKSGFYRKDIGWKVIGNAIISGKFKGRSIKFLKTGSTRPLKDSVKKIFLIY